MSVTEAVLSNGGLFLAGVVAGAVNSVAGGGSLISFPALIAAGHPAIFANATNTAAVWPGSLSSALAYRKDSLFHRDLLWALMLPSLVGGLLGALVLVRTPPALFDRIVPGLVLFATLIFAFRDRLARWSGSHAEGHERVGPMGRVFGFLFQLFVATYGGYFGAGIGILMLGSLSIMGLRDIHRMNGLKTVLGTVINVVAFAFLATQGLILWRVAALMAVGTILGGWFGARWAQRVNQVRLRTFIVAVGLSVSAWLVLRGFGG
jgi:uncharacterized membrane protein YfcA